MTQNRECTTTRARGRERVKDWDSITPIKKDVVDREPDGGNRGEEGAAGGDGTSDAALRRPRTRVRTKATPRHHQKNEWSHLKKNSGKKSAALKNQ
ncbi:hypothetical protein Y032_0408g916 [Ancylostoma ceylanicum]|uniref:Uncharacterized protein n=1 Tax=Ancylostoma ceylanicum TaxID=53326 RepID=A0A016X204_9BILA|nr:hypothetical protein Y032_0408g916 [Ancylostoma ceylanicum]